jgi:hypothetical protein
MVQPRRTGAQVDSGPTAPRLPQPPAIGPPAGMSGACLPVRCCGCSAAETSADKLNVAGTCAIACSISRLPTPHLPAGLTPGRPMGRLAANGARPSAAHPTNRARGAAVFAAGQFRRLRAPTLRALGARHAAQRSARHPKTPLKLQAALRSFWGRWRLSLKWIEEAAPRCGSNARRERWLESLVRRSHEANDAQCLRGCPCSQRAKLILSAREPS